MEKTKSYRPVPGLSRQEEEKQLTEIIGVAQKNLERTEGYIKQLSDELYDLMETYGPKDKEALSLLHNTQSQLREYKRDMLRCQKARKKPYFGRIDFKDPNFPMEESYYVGRVGISKSGSEPLVIDWRAPVASVYYENAMGLCKYVVKNEGTYEVDLKRKRTYEIAEDKLKDFFDSDVVANDELLTKYLAKSKKAVLGEIIATIQKEQNAIIRKSPRTNLIVQGVAGSGKTTVAMHRISYILYNYEEEFRPEDFYIIGSNRILLNYITSVLPDLDVYGVAQMTMEQLFVRLLYEDWDARVHRICPIDKKDPLACRKGSYEWFHDLEQFCRDYERAAIPRKEIRIEKNGVLLLDEKAIDTYVENNPQLSMQGKILMLNEMLLSKLENELSGKYVSYTPAEKKELQRTFRWYFGKDVWKGSIYEVYKEFLQSQEQQGKGIQGRKAAALKESVSGDTREGMEAVAFTENTFDVYDLAALAYIYKRIKETDGIREASHVIIDEAQDFGMMAYGALAYCMRGCTYTIMGDVSQNIHFGYGLNDWKDLQDLILTGTFDSFGLLKKSYRNTVEISDFATEILRHGNFSIYPVEPIIRHGNDVQVMECGDEDGMIREAVRTIQDWQKDGHETIAVICRDEEEAQEVSSRLGKTLTLVDSNLETTEFGSGVMVLPVEYTKGLEFDAVLIYHPSAENYPAEDQYVKLLYVAATRALHELTVIHQGDLTELIGKPVSEEKRMQSLENEMRKEAKRYEKKGITIREQQQLDVLQGNKERAMRDYLGPKPIVVEPMKKSGGSGLGKTRKPEISEQKPGLSVRGMAQKSGVQQSKASQFGKQRMVTGQSGMQQSESQRFGMRQPEMQKQEVQRSDSQRLRTWQSGSQKVHKQQVGTQKEAQEESQVSARISARDTDPVNPSPYRFGDIPDNSILRPQGHSRIDNSVRMVKKTKKYLDSISSYGTLRLTPVEENIIRVQFVKGPMAVFEPGYWNYEPESPVTWTAKEGRNLAEITTGKLVVRIDKKTGAIKFFNKQGKLLLSEKDTLPRQLEAAAAATAVTGAGMGTGMGAGAGTFRSWIYFDWAKNEKLYAKGMLVDDLERMNQKARYISFGGKKLRMPLLVSEYGYGIAVAAEKTAMCCAIPMYGPYLYMDGAKQADYYFLYGEDREHTLELYKKVGR